MRNYEQDVVDLLNRLKYFGPLAACSGQGGFAWDLIRCRIRILNSPHCSSQLASCYLFFGFRTCFRFLLVVASSLQLHCSCSSTFKIQSQQLFLICLCWGEIAHSIQISSVHQIQHSRCNRECRQSSRYGRVWWLIPACEFPIVGVLVDVKWYGNDQTQANGYGHIFSSSSLKVWAVSAVQVCQPYICEFSRNGRNIPQRPSPNGPPCGQGGWHMYDYVCIYVMLCYVMLCSVV